MAWAPASPKRLSLIRSSVKQGLSGKRKESRDISSPDENDYVQLRKDAFVGDARFSAAVCEVLYRKYPEETVGDLSERKALLISNATMASSVTSARPGLTLPEHNHHEEQTRRGHSVRVPVLWDRDRRACVKRWTSHVLKYSKKISN
jgi:hypothetical protein